ncbi:MAG: dTMP kinase [Thermodesulfobacteriota bacterium]
MVVENKFIVLEGLDGSGKTTICKKLCQILNGEIYKTPSYPFSNFRNLIDDKVNMKARFFFYLSSVLHASEEIKNMLKKSHVVCDRYILSTICYHIAAEQSLNYFDKNQIDILKPNYTFYLNAEYNIRMRRISQRENTDLTDTLHQKLHDEHFQNKVKKEFLKHNEIICVDTNIKSPEEIAHKIYSDIMTI